MSRRDTIIATVVRADPLDLTAEVAAWMQTDNPARSPWVPFVAEVTP